MVFNQDKPLKIINTPKNSSAAIIKLNQYVDTYLYVVKFLDEEISYYEESGRKAIPGFVDKEGKQLYYNQLNFQ